MTKVIMNVGYNEYILDIQDAVTVMEIMTKAEMYKERWRNTGSTYHVWTDEEKNTPHMVIKPIGESLYRTAKLAGEPKED